MLLGAIECELPYPTLHEVVVPLGGPPPSRSLQGENARFPQVHFPTGGGPGTGGDESAQPVR